MLLERYQINIKSKFCWHGGEWQGGEWQGGSAGAGGALGGPVVDGWVGRCGGKGG